MPTHPEPLAAAIHAALRGIPHKIEDEPEPGLAYVAFHPKHLASAEAALAAAGLIRERPSPWLAALCVRVPATRRVDVIGCSGTLAASHADANRHPGPRPIGPETRVGVFAPVPPDERLGQSQATPGAHRG